jgi:hypothetical protein
MKENRGGSIITYGTLITTRLLCLISYPVV